MQPDWSASVPLALLATFATGTFALQSIYAIRYRLQISAKRLRSNLGWYNRGYILHFDGGEIPQFFTFRLFDSLPQTVIEKWREETAAQGEEGKIIFRKNVENYLDCYGNNPVKAGLCATAKDWRFSSAFYRKD